MTMYSKRIAQRNGYSSATRRPTGDNAAGKEGIKRDWKRGDICAARVIGEKRAPSLVIHCRTGRVVYYSLERQAHSQTGHQIWTFADVMEPKSAAVEAVKKIEDLPALDAELSLYPLTLLRINEMLTASDLWHSIPHCTS